MAPWQVIWGPPEHGQIIATCSLDRTVRIWEEQETGAVPHPRPPSPSRPVPRPVPRPLSLVPRREV